MRWLILTLLTLLAACTAQSTQAEYLTITPAGFFTLTSIPSNEKTLPGMLILTNPTSIPLTQLEIHFTGHDPSILDLTDFEQKLTLPPRGEKTIEGNAKLTLPEEHPRITFNLQGIACFRIQPMASITICKDCTPSYTQLEGPLRITHAQVEGTRLLLTLTNNGNGLVYAQFEGAGSCILPAESWLGRISIRQQDGLGILLNGKQYACEDLDTLGETMQEQHQTALHMSCTIPDMPDQPTTALLTLAYRYRTVFHTQTLTIPKSE